MVIIMLCASHHLMISYSVHVFFPLLLTLVLLNILNYLDALARLKERIKKQKEQVSRLSPTNSTPGEAYSKLWNLLVDLSQ